MTREDILDAILPLNEGQSLHWLITLGSKMTVSARVGYPKVQDNIAHLVAF